MVLSGKNAENVEMVDGISVEKKFDEDEYTFPSLVYEIRSGRDDVVRVRIREPVPDFVSVEEIGFHQDLGAEHWTVRGDALEFERAFEPGESLRTVYAFRADSTSMTDDLLAPPETIEIESEGTEPSENEPRKVQEPKPMARSSADSPYREAAVDDDEESAGDDPPTAGGVELRGVDDDSDDVAGDRTADAGSDRVEDGAEGDVEASRETPGSGSVLEDLASEIEAGTASAESLEILRKGLDADAPTGARDARLAQLEDDIAGLRAYKNALEEFLDEEGAAKEIIGDFDERLTAVEAELDSLQSTVDGVGGDVASLETQLEAVDQSVGSATSDLDELETEFESLSADVDDIETRLPTYSIDERFEDIEDELTTVSDFVDRLRTAFD